MKHSHSHDKSGDLPIYSAFNTSWCSELERFGDHFTTSTAPTKEQSLIDEVFNPIDFNHRTQTEPQRSPSKLFDRCMYIIDSDRQVRDVYHEDNQFVMIISNPFMKLIDAMTEIRSPRSIHSQLRWIRTIRLFTKAMLKDTTYENEEEQDLLLDILLTYKA